MVRTARSVGVCLLLLSHSVLLHADVIPGRWEKVEAQAPGIGLTVIMKSGDWFDCAYKELQMDTLVVETSAGERRIPKVDIQRLETSELVPDPVKDGTLKGAVIGAVVLAVLGGLACDPNSFICDSRLTWVAVGAGRHSTAAIRTSTVSGSFRAGEKSLIELRETNQIANPDRNRITENSQLRADDESSVFGDSVFSDFSTGLLLEDSTHNGDMRCRDGSDVFCAAPGTQIIGGTSDCSLCLKP